MNKWAQAHDILIFAGIGVVLAACLVALAWSYWREAGETVDQISAVEIPPMAEDPAPEEADPVPDGDELGGSGDRGSPPDAPLSAEEWERLDPETQADTWIRELHALPGPATDTLPPILDATVRSWAQRQALAQFAWRVKRQAEAEQFAADHGLSLPEWRAA